MVALAFRLEFADPSCEFFELRARGVQENARDAIVRLRDDVRDGTIRGGGVRDVGGAGGGVVDSDSVVFVAVARVIRVVSLGVFERLFGGVFAEGVS